MSVEIAKHLFTAEQYERMIETGILTKYDRVELIEGEIVEMSSIGNRHAACVARLTDLLSDKLARRAILWVQNPIVLGPHSRPQPDVVLLKRRDDFYAQATPEPSDVLLLVEVSDATLKFDRQVKMPLYAREGIEELWVVNLQDNEIEIYARPSGGAYQLVRRAGRGETVNSENVAGLALEVDAVLG
ncbi:MAG TPA: Uma2 family endonuclease [Pyrinomonadaceae bacterium]|nr:Uma2 family endonuclease [Pyrinomonadaceae bacterium]